LLGKGGRPIPEQTILGSSTRGGGSHPYDERKGGLPFPRVSGKRGFNHGGKRGFPGVTIPSPQQLILVALWKGLGGKGDDFWTKGGLKKRGGKIFFTGGRVSFLKGWVDK